MRVLPEPSMMVVSARRSVGMGVAEIFSMRLPRMRTCMGAESSGDLPSKMRTLVKSVTRWGGVGSGWSWPVSDMTAVERPAAATRQGIRGDMGSGEVLVVGVNFEGSGR